ncbi:MAG: DNA-directed RNA polymerase subunit alpha [Parcubacteria group bacterium Athens1014_26]|nr:MAG: DNA-directed RNA polymerase subunit alpha [Parcubacteria group bacterium Athens1014_26]
MEFIYLSESVNIRKISEDNTDGIFEVEGLYGGYGLTVGNALRRVLLSSLPGAVITQIKVKGINHEFSTLPNIVEDIVEIGLNLKKVRFKIHTDEAQTLTLKVKGEKEVTAKDIELNAQAEVITPDIHIATLTSKNADLEIELKVEKGLGYVPVEARKLEKLPIGTISLDAFFSPVTRVNFSVENMRVGDRTDYNKLRIEIKTDGSITPSAAIHKAGNILKDHFEKISKIEIKEMSMNEVQKEKKVKAAKVKKTKKKE